MITVYGSSDDLIEVEGAIREEFTYLDGDGRDGDLLAFSDGTVLRIHYTAHGVWRITPIVRGRAHIDVAQADEGGGYTDRVTLSGDLGCSNPWVVHGLDFAQADR